jgi:hypothetical protein
MPSVLKKYVESNGLPLGKTVEETLNTVLESLRKQPENIAVGKFRAELISSCSVALNGLGRIEDPVKLFKNLTLAFEKRVYCIYTQTVGNAFNRLYSDAVKRGRKEEIFSVWKKLRNPSTKAHSGKHVPVEELKKLFTNKDYAVRLISAGTFVQRKDTTPDDIQKLLNHKNKYVRLGATIALAKRNSSPEPRSLQKISGKRGQRKREMNRRTSELRKPKITRMRRL